MKKVSIGYQQYDELITNNLFYIDKTRFIEEWWESGDKVTLIARPRRFGKTLTMSMTEQFFSVDFKEREDLFRDTYIWTKEKYREIQGTYPVISLSFSDIKESSFDQARKLLIESIVDLYNKYSFLAEGDLLTEREKEYFNRISSDSENYEIIIAIRRLSDFLFRFYHKKVIILLDEYDTPMQEAYVSGYWKEFTEFTRGLFNSAFKSNSFLERAILTGITRVSKESIFSDLNNIEVVTVTTEKYEDIFGFTETEVFQALEEYGLYDRRDEVKRWYDGFTFGRKMDIYNPWSILNYIDKRKVDTYWVNTSSNALIGKVIQQGSRQIKEDFELLLAGKTVLTEIDEQIVYNRLDLDETAVWSLLLAGGYLKVRECIQTDTSAEWSRKYRLAVTNFEVMLLFRKLVREWFSPAASNYNEFTNALLQNDVRAMNVYINRISQATFSYFDSGNRPSSESEPERFYHGFVLGLIVDLNDQYVITSNRESGFGRYDVMLEPKRKERPAIIMEFKVQDKTKEKDLISTAQAALRQIRSKGYAAILQSKGIDDRQIYEYGFAFCGKEVYILGSRDEK